MHQDEETDLPFINNVKRSTLQPVILITLVHYTKYINLCNPFKNYFDHILNKTYIIHSSEELLLKLNQH